MTKQKKRTQHEKFLIKEINKLKYNIERRLNRINKARLEKGIQSKAYESYMFRVNERGKNKGKRYYDTSVKGKSARELTTILNRLKYFNTLSTSTIKGAKDYTINLNKINNIINLDKTEGEKFRYIYDSFMETRIGWGETFKYNITDFIIENINKGKSKDEILTTLDELYNKYFNEDFNEQIFSEENLKNVFVSKKISRKNR